VSCAYDQAGGEIRFTTFDTSRVELRTIVDKQRPAVVIIEACLLAGWVHDIVVRRGRTFWEPTRQLAAVSIHGDGRLSLEDVRNEWATRRIEITGPASSDLRTCSCTQHGRAPGSNAAARIVECNPRRHAAADERGWAQTATNTKPRRRRACVFKA
jgi:hypothetical protein